MPKNKETNNQSLAYKEAIALELFRKMTSNLLSNAEGIAKMLAISEYCWKKVVNEENVDIPSF